MKPQTTNVEEILETMQAHVDQIEIELAIAKQAIEERALSYGQNLTCKIAGNKTVPATYQGKFCPVKLMGIISEWEPDNSELVVAFYFTRPMGGAHIYKLTPLQAEEFTQAWVEGNLHLELDYSTYSVK
jgi:hypothetical protein